MTREQIVEFLTELGIEYRYHHFTQKELQTIELPVIVWDINEKNNFFADGIVYHKTKVLNIKVYTQDRDWDLEEKIETMLTERGITWNYASDWLQKEEIWETVYEMEV